MFKKDADQAEAKRVAALEKDAARRAGALERDAPRMAAAAQKQAAGAEAAFRATPRGRARAAREAGAGFFQYSGLLAATTRTAIGVLSGKATAAGHKRREHSGSPGPA